MSDETEGKLHARSHLIAQGTAHSTDPSPTAGHHEIASAIPPNALLSQPRPNPTSPPDSTAKATSQPVITTSSSSPAQTSNAMDTTGPSPYGTRSRNRTGNARPNYAEDREPDAEYEWTTTKRNHASAVPASANQSQTADGERSSGVNTRRSSTTASITPANKAAAANATKDPIPGMSSFSVNAETGTSALPLSRKRKAPGTHAILNAPTGTNSAIPVSSVDAQRKHGNGASANGIRETNTMSFEGSQAMLRDGKLHADDGTTLKVNDHVYLICEPPGEPYYLARIMDFHHVDNDHSLPVESVKVNWYYRPRDIQRKVNDTRVVFATMHSDPCPLTSLRGKCQVSHPSEIADLDEYRKTRDCFWYDKMFDRYIHRYYEVIPTTQVINVPTRVKKVLDERWKYVIVELGRGKELTSAIKTCRRCSSYCANNGSVDCAMCKTTYHMNCVQPPLLKKPARGFGWSCGPCSRKQERKLQARNTPIVGDKSRDAEEDELPEEEEEERGNATDGSGPHETEPQGSGPRPPTADQTTQAELWPYRYLGIHCRVEDALDFDDRIYPRASSRLGPKHQANVHVWHGRPVRLVKPAESKRKYLKGGSHKKDVKNMKEASADLETDKSVKEKRPKWVMDAPPGYIARGEDHPNDDLINTAKVMFRMPQVGEVSSRGLDDHGGDALDPEEREKIIDDYMEQAKDVAPSLGVQKFCTNFLDKALELLYKHQYSIKPALAELQIQSRRKDLKEPEYSKEELKRFEEGVKKYGSEHRLVSKHVGKSHKLGEIIRFYYMWKKSMPGHAIWDNHESRKGKKSSRQVDSKLVDDVADDVDDSAFDNGKASVRKRGFECKFCATRKSPQWRRAPATAPGTTVPIDSSSKNSKDKSAHLMVALCQRCAGLWRKYGIQWENIDEVAKQAANAGGRAWKRKIDEELLRELINANDASAIGISERTAAAANSIGVEVPSGLTIQPGQEGSRKKQKTAPEAQTPQPTVYAEPPKKKVVEKPPEPPLAPEPPRLKTLPCAVCYEMEPMGNQLLSCRHCRLTVHRSCYGVPEGRAENKWTCDMCANDSTNQISTSYECVLCPTQPLEQELMEPPRVSHKKKTDREREKERLEREMVVDATNMYYREQEAKGRPLHPREALKRTSGNNWAHLVCSMWTPELKYGDAQLFEPVEGVSSIPPSRYQQVCKLCKETQGICIACKQCSTTYHATCAQRHGHILGFDIAPVKGSRRDAISVITMGSETGNATPIIYCKEHAIKTTIHPLNEVIDESSLIALQLFSRNCKQADTSLTGTVRKAANIVSSSRPASQLVSVSNGHRNSSASVAATSTAITRSSRVSPVAMTVKSEQVDEEGDRVVYLNDVTVAEPLAKECNKCGTSTSPLWHQIEPKVICSRQESNQALQMTSSGSQTQANGFVHGNGTAIPESPRTSAAAPESPLVNGHTQDSREVRNGIETNGVTQTDGAAELPSALENPRADGVDGEITADEAPSFHCHKCHLKKLQNPTPTPVPASVPPPEVAPAEPHASHGPDMPSPLRRPAWPAPIPPVPNHEPFHHYPPQQGPQSSFPPRIPNGIPHSPPAASPALQSHFAPPPGAYHGPPPYHAPPPPRQDMPPQSPMNGNPPIYHFQRASGGRPANIHFVSHAPRPPPAAPPPQPPPINVPRSPPRPTFMQGPHGPPRPEENPFAPVSRHSHPSPRDPYHGAYGSPRTPPDRLGRNGGWPPGDPMNNGASASPSVRNLLR